MDTFFVYYYVVMAILDGIAAIILFGQDRFGLGSLFMIAAVLFGISAVLS